MTIQALFDIEYPIIQAPMAGVQDSALTIAVSNAGGLGSLPCAMLDTDTLRSELRHIKAHTTQPFNVNFFCHTPPAVNEVEAITWKGKLSGYYGELSVDADLIPSGPARKPFDRETAEIVCEFKPAVVSFHFGLPSSDLLDKVRSSGAKIISSATTVEEAVWLEAQGVDAIIAQGVEAGGHRGMFLTDDLNTQMGTFTLLPQIVNAVKVPVIAAGGIADAQGIKAAMALGASGVQIGTTYMLCPEAKTSKLHRAALKSDNARLTALTNVYSGRPARGIVNRLIREQGPISDYAPKFPLATAAVAPLRSKAESQGSSDFSPLWAVQNVTGCKEISARALTQHLMGIQNTE